VSRGLPDKAALTESAARSDDASTRPTAVPPLSALSASDALTSSNVFRDFLGDFRLWLIVEDHSCE
jgi:hypothetical protein